MRAAALIGAWSVLALGCANILGIEDGVPIGEVANDASVDGPGVDPPDAGDVCATTGGVCNALTQAGCAAGEKCGARLNASGAFTTECIRDGSVAVGGTCAFADDMCSAGTQIDDCSRGGFCRDSVCQTICSAAPASCPDPDGQACIRLGGLFEDQGAPTGVCAEQCDPNEDTTCAAGDGCYLIGYQGASDLDFVCAFVPVEAVALTAGQECAPQNVAGQCFINSAPAGATITVLEALTQGSISIVAPYCRPTNTSVNELAANADGLDGAQDLGGNSIECSATNLLSGGLIGGGPAPEFGCRDVGTAFGDPTTNPEGGDVNTFIGMCVPQNGSAVGGTGWNESTIWDPQDLVDDAADGQIDNPTVSLCFGCLNADALALLFPAVKLGQVTDTATRRFLQTATFYHERP